MGGGEEDSSSRCVCVVCERNGKGLSAHPFSRLIELRVCVFTRDRQFNNLGRQLELLQLISDGTFRLDTITIHHIKDLSRNSWCDRATVPSTVDHHW